MTDLRPLRWPRLRELSADGKGGVLIRRALRARGGERRAILRDLAFRLARNFTPSFAIEVDGVQFHLDTADREVSRIVFIFGLYERPVMEAAFTALAHHGGRRDLGGSRILDIGANIGTATLTAIAHFGAEGSYAFEPDPRNYRSLRVNVEANDLADRVESFQVALSASSGTVDFERSELNYGDHRVRVRGTEGASQLGERDREVIAVEARTLDELVAEGLVDLTRIGLAWVDVQGHEAHLLAGATKLLDASTPVVIEYWPYGLRAAGALERFQELLGAHYRRFVDLGGPKGVPVVESRPITDLSMLAHSHPGADDHTDLLLLSD